MAGPGPRGRASYQGSAPAPHGDSTAVGTQCCIEQCACPADHGLLNPITIDRPHAAWLTLATASGSAMVSDAAGEWGRPGKLKELGGAGDGTACCAVRAKQHRRKKWAAELAFWAGDQSVLLRSSAAASCNWLHLLGAP